MPLKLSVLIAVVLALALAAPAAGASRTRDVLYVGNNWDGTADVVDPQSFKRIARLNVIPDIGERLAEIRRSPERRVYFHAIRHLVGEGHDQFVDDMFSSPDGRLVYVSRPSLADVVALDVRSQKIVWRTKVDGHRADHMAISPDSRRLLVSASTAANVNVIDTASGAIVGRIPSGDQPHENNYSSDGNLIYHASIGSVYTPLDEPVFDATKGRRYFQVVDAHTNKVLRRVQMGRKLAEAGYPNMSSAVRPMTLSPSERYLFFQVSFLHGFVEYDLYTDRVLRLVHLPVSEKAKRMRREEYLLDSAHHGLAMNPEGTKLCVAGTMSDYAAIVDRGSFGHRLASFGKRPYWATNSADGRYCFVSYSGDDAVTVISYRTEREVARFGVGDHPQRMRMGKALLDAGCLARRSRASRRGIAGVRVGLRRGAAERRVAAPPVRRTRRSTRWCVEASRGHVTAAHTRRRRVGLVLSTARRHGNRGVSPGRRASRLPRAYPNRRRLGRGLYRAGPRSRLVLGTRRGKVRFVAVASRSVLQNRRILRRYLRLAGVRR